MYDVVAVATFAPCCPTFRYVCPHHPQFTPPPLDQATAHALAAVPRGHLSNKHCLAGVVNDPLLYMKLTRFAYHLDPCECFLV